ncbi:protein kinase 4-like [Protopterus annectens]|uniref:protein kinase 4-like n=1 Tax=Protopterus annectens TaxID=7888 RepID=UPI001CF94421|nr:protein kinase 4-like [Protopterus annectens]
MATGSQLLFEDGDSLTASESANNSNFGNNKSASIGKLTALIELLTQRVDTLASQVAGVLGGTGVGVDNVFSNGETRFGASGVNGASNAGANRNISGQRPNGCRQQTNGGEQQHRNNSGAVIGTFRDREPNGSEQQLNGGSNNVTGSNDQVNSRVAFSTVVQLHNRNGHELTTRSPNGCEAQSGSGTFNNGPHAHSVFDVKLFKFKKLQVEVQYLRECSSRRQIPKGLRQWRFRNGLIAHSDFHKELIQLFDKQGLEFIDCLIKHYCEQITVLESDLTVLDNSIRTDKDFGRYKFDFLRVFSSIENSLCKIKENKIKKLKRDSLAYDNGTAYPLPKMHTSNGNNQNNMNNDSNVNGMFDNFDIEASFEACNNPNEHDTGNGDNFHSPVRRSERLASRNNNNNQNNDAHPKGNNNKKNFQRGGNKSDQQQQVPRYQNQKKRKNQNKRKR